MVIKGTTAAHRDELYSSNGGPFPRGKMVLNPKNQSNAKLFKSYFNLTIQIGYMVAMQVPQSTDLIKRLINGFLHFQIEVCNISNLVKLN